MRTIPALILACLLPVVGSAQIPDNASLDGKYYFVHLLALVSGARDPRTRCSGLRSYPYRHFRLRRTCDRPCPL